MNFIKTPVKGMPEQLPNDTILREYVLNTIKQTYFKFGFSQIETPIVEHIENLTSNQGGENEKLIFKVLKIILLRDLIFLKYLNIFRSLKPLLANILDVWSL